MRMTEQRALILKILRSTKSHPTADWIYQEARKEMPNISLGTVYRNLRVLAEAGAIMELDYGSGYSRYDGNPENHYHFQCQACGKMYDVDIELVHQLDELVEESLGAIIHEHRLEFYGICKDCQENNH
ncbi:MAG TPA: transcriptional repressor [Firmicutes bacterium]|jgi:Fur family peroxide stress response transcriptional regulator|nr:transcriptional repressor [Bacillota bacterium]